MSVGCFESLKPLTLAELLLLIKKEGSQIVTMVFHYTPKEVHQIELIFPDRISQD